MSFSLQLIAMSRPIYYNADYSLHRFNGGLHYFLSRRRLLYAHLNIVPVWPPPIPYFFIPRLSHFRTGIARAGYPRYSTLQ